MTSGPEDRGETVSLVEPLRLEDSSRHRAKLTDLVFELGKKSASLKSSLPASLLAPLAALVRSMNCYYSNLIEGHNTHPIDIERALNNDYSKDKRRRDLQLEATAHIGVQKWIDEGGLKGGRAVQIEGICEIHRRFCDLLPEDLLWVNDPGTQERVRVVAGKLRERDVEVGQHLAISPGALPRFLRRYGQAYEKMSDAESVLATAAAHHRLLWIHPFLDGNGRVARLTSHALMLDALDTGAIWSVARGLARSVETYKRLLAKCDMQRRNDLDGRGNLSEEALAEFTAFFLNICLDQVTFMAGLIQPGRLRTRILQWAEEEIRLGMLPSRSGEILDVILYRGELQRGDAEAILGTSARQARRVVSALVERGVLQSESSRAPLLLAFPAALAYRWMPGLFPEKTE